MPQAQFTAMEVPGARESEADSGATFLQGFSGTLLYKRLTYCLRATCQCNCGGGWCDLPGCGPLLRGRCSRRRNLYHLELSRWGRTSGGVPAEPTAADSAYCTRMG